MKNEAFADPKSDELDLHYINECIMLQSCEKCNKVVEIWNVNSHLLDECSSRDEFKECPRCHEAVAADVFEDHKQDEACLVRRHETVVSRCPLCHQDIPAGPEGWHAHMAVDSEERCPIKKKNSSS